MAKNEERWLSVGEISEHLGISNDTVYRWIEKHNMPAYRISRFWKFKKGEIDSWVKDGGPADIKK